MLLPMQSSLFLESLSLYHTKVCEELFCCKGGAKVQERSLRMKQDVQLISSKYCDEITQGWINDIPAKEIAQRIQNKHWDAL